jgi:hypothetical protein
MDVSPSKGDGVSGRERDRVPGPEAWGGAGLRGRAAAAAGVLLLAAAPLAPAAAQSTHLVVVSGLGGGPEYTARFAEWGGALVEAAVAAGVPEDHIVWLAEREDVAAGVDGVARKERLMAELAGLAERSSAGDVVAVVLFGHGSARDGESRLNLPGPDLTAGELAVFLEPLAERRIVVVNAASASGGFIAPLSAPGRIVITATRSPREAEATRFGGPFVEAFAGDGADTDKDGRVSMLEAFEYARREVARSFAEGGHLPTEHALLDDNADGEGSLEPGTDDGALAARLALAPGGRAGAAASTGSGDPALEGLRTEQARLEAELEELRARKDAMPEEEYEAELERLLLEIARVGRQIRQGGTDGAGDPGSGGPS